MIPVERSGRCVRFRTRTLHSSNRHFQAYAPAVYGRIAHTCSPEHDVYQIFVFAPKTAPPGRSYKNWLRWYSSTGQYL